MKEINTPPEGCEPRKPRPRELKRRIRRQMVKDISEAKTHYKRLIRQHKLVIKKEEKATGTRFITVKIHESGEDSREDETLIYHGLQLGELFISIDNESFDLSSPSIEIASQHSLIPIWATESLKAEYLGRITCYREQKTTINRLYNERKKACRNINKQAKEDCLNIDTD